MWLLALHHKRRCHERGHRQPAGSVPARAAACTAVTPHPPPARGPSSRTRHPVAARPLRQDWRLSGADDRNEALPSPHRRRHPGSPGLRLTSSSGPPSRYQIRTQHRQPGNGQRWPYRTILKQPWHVRAVGRGILLDFLACRRRTAGGELSSSGPECWTFLYCLQHLRRLSRPWWAAKEVLR